jgi:hypothetical protein
MDYVMICDANGMVDSIPDDETLDKTVDALINPLEWGEESAINRNTIAAYPLVINTAN